MTSVLGLVILLVGLRAMVKVGHAARGYVTGKSGGSPVRRIAAAGAHVGGYAAAAATGNPAMIKAGQVAGTTLKASADRHEQSKADWAQRGMNVGGRTRAPIPSGGSRTGMLGGGGGTPTRGMLPGGSSSSGRGAQRPAVGRALDTAREVRATARDVRSGGGASSGAELQKIVERHLSDKGKDADYDFKRDGYGDSGAKLGVSKEAAARDASQVAGGGIVGAAAGAAAGHLAQKHDEKHVRPKVTAAITQEMRSRDRAAGEADRRAAMERMRQEGKSRTQAPPAAAKVRAATSAKQVKNRPTRPRVQPQDTGERTRTPPAKN